MMIAFQLILNYINPPCLRAYLTIVLSFISQKLNQVGDQVLIENVQILRHMNKRRQFKQIVPQYKSATATGSLMLRVVFKLKSLKRPLKLLSGNKFGEIHKKAQIAYQKPLDI